MVETLQRIIINDLFKNYDQDEKFEKIDIWIFSLEFDDLLRNDVFKIYYCFALFFNIINYWCGVNKKVADDYFGFFPTFEHRCFR